MELLSTALSTLLGKAIAGTAVAAASIGGLAAADVVELLSLPAEAQTPVVEELPADGEVVSEAAKALRESKTETETDTAKVEDEDEAVNIEDEAGAEADSETGEPNENAEFGQGVAEDAREGGVDGQAIAAGARAGTPAEDRAAQPGAPEDVRQDADVRQDGDAPEDARPEGAGEQAEARSEAPAAAANGRP